jgi:2'-5' RNA ligase
MDADDLHLTIVFLGNVSVALVPAVAAVVARVAAAGTPFRIAVRGVGEFGGRGRARVTWLGVEDGVASMATLEAELRRGLTALPRLAHLDTDAVATPHLTVARRAPAEMAGALRDAFAAAATSWSADRLVLYRSDLGRQGARHERIVSAPLGGGLRPEADDD